MEQLDIVELAKTYGQENLIIKLYEPEQKGFFQNPLGGWKEYKIKEIAEHHKIKLELTNSVAETVAGFSLGSSYEGLMRSTFDKKSFYISDFNQFKPDRLQVFITINKDVAAKLFTK